MSDQGRVRRTILTLLSCLAVAMSGGCSDDAPLTEIRAVHKACRELRSLAEPYALNAETPPFALVRPTNSPQQWREDGESLVQAAKPLADIGGTRLRDRADRWVIFGEYLIETGMDPNAYDTDAVAERLYPADGGCSDAIEEAV